MSTESTPPIQINPGELSQTQQIMATTRTRLGRAAAAGLLVLGGSSAFFAEGVVASPTVAFADAIDNALAAYPDINEPCEHAPYNVTGACSDYDWGPVHTQADDDPSENSSRGYAFRNCTDWVAYREATLAGVTVPKGLGDGGQWYGNVPAKEQSSTPEAWDAAVKPGTPGHVAFIESVNSIDPSNPDDDNITVSEYNHDYDGDPDQRTGTAASMGFTEFVDFGKHPSGTPSTGNSGITNSDPSSKIAVAQVPSGAMEVFARGVNNDLQTNWQSTSGGLWQPSVGSLGGDITGNPVAFVGSNGAIEVFARGANNDVETIWQTSPGGSWSGWLSLGGDIVGDPIVMQGTNGALEWFARGANNDVQTNWQSAAGGGWQNTAGSLGGNITTDPVAVQGSNGAFELFGRGPGGDVDTTWQSGAGGNWSAWANLGGDIAPNQTIAVGQGASGAFEWFATGVNGDLQTNWQSGNGGNWQSGAASMGGNITGDVEVEGNGGALEVFAQGTGDDIQTNWQSTAGGSWSGWLSLGGEVTGDPALIGSATTGYEWFARGMNGDLQTNWQTGPGTNWQPVAGSFGGGITNNPLVFAQGTSGAYEAFMRGNGGDIQTIYQLSDEGDWSGWQSLGGDTAQ